jgi:protein-S-isoprenylcysteine O-methyltransferase Ste14
MPTPTLWQSVIGLALVAVGSGLAAYVIMQLGGSFSIMPEARALVTTGAYSWVRHPLYLAEEIAVVGLVIHFTSLPALILFVTHGALQIMRIRNEERVLEGAFPEYAEYRQGTWRLIPRVW